MFRLIQSLVLLSLFVLVGAGCESGVTPGESYHAEGDDPGECSDGADNDGDGFFDCLDEACVGAPAC